MVFTESAKARALEEGTFTYACTYILYFYVIDLRSGQFCTIPFRVMRHSSLILSESCRFRLVLMVQVQEVTYTLRSS